METPPNVAVAISSTHISNLVSFLVFFFSSLFQTLFFLCVSWHVFEFRVAFVRISVRVKNSFVRLFIFFFTCRCSVRVPWAHKAELWRDRVREKKNVKEHIHTAREPSSTHFFKETLPTKTNLIETWSQHRTNNNNNNGEQQQFQRGQ